MKKNSVRSAGVFLFGCGHPHIGRVFRLCRRGRNGAGAKRETESLSMDDSVDGTAERRKNDSRTGGHDDKWGGFTHDLFGGRMLLGD